jgi:hypothetical protein
MPGLAVRLICEGTGQGAVSTPPLDSGGHVQHGVPGQRVMEHESAAVLINGDQEGLRKVRDAIQHAGVARGGGQDTEVPSPLQCRKQEQCAAHLGRRPTREADRTPSLLCGESVQTEALPRTASSGSGRIAVRREAATRANVASGRCSPNPANL